MAKLASVFSFRIQIGILLEQQTMPLLQFSLPAAFCVITLGLNWPLAAQQLLQEGRQRGPIVGASQARAGGIPRAEVLQDDSQDELGGSQQGTDEGSPQLRQAPAAGGAAPKWLPPNWPTPQRHRWRLGVQAYNTNTGVVITQVLHNTAAQRFGFEPGDRIVAIGGYQVGWVQDQLFPLDAELQRHADQRGRVNLLVQNVRTRLLLNLPVQLDAYGNRPRNPVRSREGGVGREQNRRAVPFTAEPDSEDLE